MNERISKADRGGICAFTGGLRAAISICLATALPLNGLLGCAGGSAGESPGLFRGDRLTIEREYIHLDDPLFLQRKSVYAFRKAGLFTFRIPIYFNASQDTLRIASDGVLIRTSDSKPDPAGQGDPLPPALPVLPAVSCAADTGEAAADSAAITALFRDTGRILVFPPGRGRNRRVHLNVHCLGYDPPWGRVDTLSLAFTRYNGARHDGAQGSRETAFDLPFHVSFRGPVISILLGVGLLYGFTQAGLWISDM